MSPRLRARARAVRVLAAVAVVTSLTAACGSDAGVTAEEAEQADGDPSREGTNAPEDTDGPADTGAPDDPSADAFGWEELTDGVETGLLEVPVDYEDPEGDQFELFVARRLADDQENKIGSLLVNPGGPGFGGSDFAIYADQIYGEELLERFDIVGWDPRGTGLSEPAIDCIDDYDEYYNTTDITPDDEAERQQIVDLAEQFANECVENNDPYFAYVGTNNSARDMDAIREALGEETISYFGFSYGSELGGTWATLFPDTVRAAVLDGAVDPDEDSKEASLSQNRGFEQSIATYLADCSSDPDCAFHNDGEAEAAFDELMLRIDEKPLPVDDPGRPPVTRAVALVAVAQAMYSQSSWPALSQALADAQEGDGTGLLELNDLYFQRKPDGTWGNELEAFQTISCMDDPERTTVAEEDADAPEFQANAPRYAPGTTGSYFCTFFPESIDPRIEITGEGAGPIVVIGTTGDPATPLESTRGMAAALEDGRLVVVTAEGHTGYAPGECSGDIVHAYLVDLEVPPAETEC